MIYNVFGGTLNLTQPTALLQSYVAKTASIRHTFLSLHSFLLTPITSSIVTLYFFALELQHEDKYRRVCLDPYGLHVQSTVVT